jgi:hypothetical protein
MITQADVSDTHTFLLVMSYHLFDFSLLHTTALMLVAPWSQPIGKKMSLVTSVLKSMQGSDVMDLHQFVGCCILSLSTMACTKPR